MLQNPFSPSSPARRAFGATLAAALLVIACTGGGVYCISGLNDALNSAMSSSTEMALIDQALSRLSAIEGYHKTSDTSTPEGVSVMRSASVSALSALAPLSTSYSSQYEQRATISALQSALQKQITSGDYNGIPVAHLAVVRRWLHSWRDFEQLKLNSDLAQVTTKAVVLVTSFLSLAVIGVAMVIAGGRIAYRDSLLTEKNQLKLQDAHDNLEKTVAARTSQLASANRAKSQFLAIVSHELRTPLNSVVGYSHLLSTGALDDEQKHHVEAIDVAGKSLLSVISDILDFSTVEGGDILLQKGPTSPAKIIQGVVAENVDKKDGVNVESAIAEGTPEWVLCDAGRLEQIISNLVHNAVKFTESGTVTVGTEVVTEDGISKIEFYVSDTGPGIADELRTHIFKPFVWFDSSTRRRHGGVGLGLAMVQRLTHALGGQVYFESELGVGTRFHLRLPYELTVPVSEVPDSSFAEDMHVLVVEDNAANRRLLTHMLGRLGVNVVAVEDGLAGVEAAGRDKYDLIFMDIEMPRMDGLEATTRIRETEGHNAARSRIVAFTAHVVGEIKTQCLDVGMDDFLAKPVSITAIRKQLNLVKRSGL